VYVPVQGDTGDVLGAGVGINVGVGAGVEAACLEALHPHSSSVNNINADCIAIGRMLVSPVRIRI
jgi:hypothetical protein